MTDNEIHNLIDTKNQQIVTSVNSLISGYTESITTLITTENKSIKNSIDQLTERVKRQNGSVRRLNEWKSEHCGEETGREQFEERQQVADDLKIRIEKEGEDRKVVKDNLKAKKINDHWQRTIGVLMAVFAFCTLSILIIVTTNKLTRKVEQKEYVSKTTRSGYVKYIDQGYIDSVKVRQVTKDTIK